ncbi:MAG: ferritin-like domain-containing protein [Chloroflexota bacterium]
MNSNPNNPTLKTRENLIDWLKDAHAMEQQAIEILEKQRDRLENYPEAKIRIAQHVEESKKQAERVASCIEMLDGGASTMKDTIGKVSGNISAMMNAMATDEVVKNAIANYSFEHFEIACYKSLIEAAREVGEDHVARVCEQNLNEEIEMAKWCEQNLPIITKEFLHRDEMDSETAKR